MKILMIVLSGVLLLSGCTAVQSSNPEITQTESDITQTEPDPMQIEMVFVEGGTFIMGCTTEQRDVCSDAEKPAHQVTLSDFYIGKYPVTQRQWNAVMGNNPSTVRKDDLPVDGVLWGETQEFIKKLNEKTGGHYRLPTEAEWEYAARGGKQSRGYKYSGSDNMDEVAWYGEDYSKGAPHPVGMKKANELGIYDMSGNVYEWVNDWGQLFYTSIPQTNPLGPESGTSHVTRGGSCFNRAGVRVSNRGGDQDRYRIQGQGFRLASGDMTNAPLPDTPAHYSAAQLKAVCEPDSREIVEKFFQYDFEGYWLGSVFHKENWEYLTWENVVIGGEGPKFVTKSFRVVSTEEYEDACRVKVHFSAYGYIDSEGASEEKVGIVFYDSPSEEEGTVVVRCLEEGDCRINTAEFDLRPHPGKDTVYKWLEGLYRMQQGAPSREQEVRDLQKRIKSLP